MSETNEVVAGPQRAGRSSGRGNPLSRLALFFRQVVAELRKVVWPGRRQLLTYTAVVIVFVLVVMAYVGLLDAVFAKLAFWIFA